MDPLYSPKEVREILIWRLYEINQVLNYIIGLSRIYDIPAPTVPNRLRRPIKLYGNLELMMVVNPRSSDLRSYLTLQFQAIRKGVGSGKVISLPHSDLYAENMDRVLKRDDRNHIDPIVDMSLVDTLAHHPKALATVLRFLDELHRWLIDRQAGLVRHLDEIRRQHENSKARRVIARTIEAVERTRVVHQLTD